MSTTTVISARYETLITARNFARPSSPPRSARPSSGTISSFTAPLPASCFGKLFFPNQDPLTAAAAFGTYFVGFVGRPIGAAIFGHYGDRIGRKATLIATLLLHGHRHLPDRLRADLRSRSASGAP